MLKNMYATMIVAGVLLFGLVHFVETSTLNSLKNSMTNGDSAMMYESSGTKAKLLGTLAVENLSNNEKNFYQPEKLNILKRQGMSNIEIWDKSRK